MRSPNRNAFPFERLAQEPFLMREPGSGTRTLVEEIFARTACSRASEWNSRPRGDQAGNPRRPRRIHHVALHAGTRRRAGSARHSRCRGLSAGTPTGISCTRLVSSCDSGAGFMDFTRQHVSSSCPVLCHCIVPENRPSTEMRSATCAGPLLTRRAVPAASWSGIRADAIRRRR